MEFCVDSIVGPTTIHTCGQRYAQGRVATLQSLSGTGSLRVAAAFIAKFLPGTAVYISKPTWGNHKNIFGDAGTHMHALYSE